MKLVQIDNYEIKVARTEHKVPVVNGVHLHSIYNPIKEAEALAEKHQEVLETKSEVLILGLGFAYHVNEIIKTLTKAHGDQFKIVIIEPNVAVHNDCIDQGLLNNKNVLIYAGFSADELYSDIDLVHFLLRKPTVIAHPSSFNLYQMYFKNILAFEAPRAIGESLGFVANESVKDYLSKFNQNLKLGEILATSIPEKSKFEEMDFLAMALAEITKAQTNKKQENNNGDV